MKNNSVDVIIFLVRIVCTDVILSCVDTPVVKIQIIQCIPRSENDIKPCLQIYEYIQTCANCIFDTQCVRVRCFFCGSFLLVMLHVGVCSLHAYGHLLGKG